MTALLRDKARDLVSSRQSTLKEISEATGVSAAWLSRFACGEIKDGSSAHVQRVYEYLSGRRLEIQ